MLVCVFGQVFLVSFDPQPSSSTIPLDCLTSLNRSNDTFERMVIEAIRSITVLCEFTRFVKIHTRLTEAAPRKEWAFLTGMKIFTRLVFTERKILTSNLTLAQELFCFRNTIPFTLFPLISLFCLALILFNLLFRIRDLNRIRYILSFLCLFLQDLFRFWFYALFVYLFL